MSLPVMSSTGRDLVAEWSFRGVLNQGRSRPVSRDEMDCKHVHDDALRWGWGRACCLRNCVLADISPFGYASGLLCCLNWLKLSNERGKAFARQMGKLVKTPA